MSLSPSSDLEVRAEAPFGSPEGASVARTNPLAIAAFLSFFVLPLAAIVLGHLALGQIARSGEQGRGLAIAALVLGYGTVAILAAVVLGSVLLLVAVAALPVGLS